MKSFLWEPAARAGLRKLDRETAMRILLILTRYGDTGEGDVKSSGIVTVCTAYELGNGDCFSIWTPLARCEFTVSTIAGRRTDDNASGTATVRVPTAGSAFLGHFPDRTQVEYQSPLRPHVSRPPLHLARPAVIRSV
ncbi:MAG TPA: hypothetical protein VNY05_00455 [Candidatus Acidoferrales bacterium]|jgi:hypothetical protein|nr:hypothetical protein [Candidatus Acidoferrales bacterium]